MRIISVKSVVAIALLLVLLATLIPGCTPPQTTEFDFNPVLTISDAPVLGKPVVVTLTFTPQTDFETYTARIILTPEVYEVVEGDLELSGVSGASNSLEVTLKSVRTTGSGEIVGGVRGETPHCTDWEYTYLFISITDDGATVSTTKPKYSPPPQPPETTTPITEFPDTSEPSDVTKPTTTVPTTITPPSP